MEEEVFYNKLVRDSIPEIIKKDDKIPITRIAKEDELELYLFKKLDEEINEFKNDKTPKEMADIIEVLNAICGFYGLKLDDIEKIRLHRLEKRGGFSKRIILEKVIKN